MRTIQVRCVSGDLGSLGLIANYGLRVPTVIHCAINEVVYRVSTKDVEKSQDYLYL
jgi:hypothetical protein